VEYFQDYTLLEPLAEEKLQIHRGFCIVP